MGERSGDGEGPDRYHEESEIYFKERAKEKECQYKISECSCDSTCPNFKNDKSFFDPNTITGKILIFLIVLLFWLAICYFSLS